MLNRTFASASQFHVYLPWNIVLNIKCVLVWAFSMIVKTDCETYGSSAALVAGWNVWRPLSLHPLRLHLYLTKCLALTLILNIIQIISSVDKFWAECRLDQRQGQVSCDWRKDGHVTTITNSDWPGPHRQYRPRQPRPAAARTEDLCGEVGIHRAEAAG